jgi:predicted RNase H-like nuclease (RuvC/YqgF family)
MSHSLHQISNDVARMNKLYANQEYSVGDEILHPFVDTGGIDFLLETIEQLQIQNMSLRLTNHQLRKTNKEIVSEIRNFRCKTRFKVYEENLRLAEENAALKKELEGMNQ